MARLHEHLGKQLLAAAGIVVPRGMLAASAGEAEKAAATIGCPVAVKMQAWTTGRAAMGGIAFASTPAEAGAHAAQMLSKKVGQFPVTHVLVEQKVAVAGELYLSVVIDDRERAPVLLIAAAGGSGVEERAAAVQSIRCSVMSGPDETELESAIAKLPLAGELRRRVGELARRIFDVARAHDARTLEINPLLITADGAIVAGDCRITIDDYAVYRHPDLGIEIARELDHPPTQLERIAYAVEQADHRGTFFFAQMATGAAASSKGLIGFHGAGGGGSMMSMDAVTAEGFTVANFTDTSGNPSPAKVYRAARIILEQPGLVGYFGSGSGVASQEQFWSAYGLAKAFWEMELNIPAVIRLGGNSEERAVEILMSVGSAIPAPIEGYRKTDPPAFIARRFAELVAASGTTWQPRAPRQPEFVGRSESVSYAIRGGRVWIDAGRWRQIRAGVLAHAPGLLRDDEGRPALAGTPQEIFAKDSEWIGCEVECRRVGLDAVFVELELPGLEPAHSHPRATVAQAGG